MKFWASWLPHWAAQRKRKSRRRRTLANPAASSGWGGTAGRTACSGGRGSGGDG